MQSETIQCFVKNKHADSTRQSVAWLEEAIEKHKDRLFRTALAIVGGKSDAEDIVQDVFIKLFEKQPHFESQEHEIAWLTKVTVNLCKNHLKSYWWRKTEPLLDTYPVENDEEHNVMESISMLSSKYRIVIHLYYYEGYSTQEISEITQRSEGTVRSQLTRARRILKDILEMEGEEV